MRDARVGGYVVGTDDGSSREMGYVEMFKYTMLLHVHLWSSFAINPNFYFLDRRRPVFPKIFLEINVWGDWPGATILQKCTLISYFEFFRFGPAPPVLL